MNKLELKRSLDALELKKPMRLMKGNPHFLAPEEWPVGRTEGQTTALTNIEAPRTLPGPESPILEETGSKMDPVQNEPGSKQTGSKKDPVIPVGNSDESNNTAVAYGQQSPPAPKTAQTKNRLPLIFHIGTLKPRDHYTAIPNCLLREVSAFDDPNDFMIYLRMFSLAFGFGRNTCDVGMAGLLTFTRLGKNAIRRSLERLIAQGWIKKVNDFEAGQVPRKWRVFTPWEKGLTHEPTYVTRGEPQQKNTAPENTPLATGSKIDPVRFGPGPKETQTGFKSDPLTGSKMDPYKDNKEIKIKESSLSGVPNQLQNYFSDLKPQRKRESEQKAFEEIRRDFSLTEIAKCLDYLKRKGLPGGEPCHSPMAYLATAMRDVLAIVHAEEELEKIRAESAAKRETEEHKKADESAREEREWETKERAFNRTFFGEDKQNEVIRKICRNQHFPLRGHASRAFAIGAWWSGLTTYEKQEATR